MSYTYNIVPTVAVLRALSRELGDMPNLKTPTLGGHVFWDTILEVDGWRVQVNQVFGNARILNENNVRQAWGSQAVMEDKLRRLKGGSFLRAGDVIGIKRPVGYEHYAVYIGNDRVIHYAAEDGDFGNPTIHEAPIEDFLDGDRNFFVLNFPDKHGLPDKVYSNKGFPFSFRASDMKLSAEILKWFSKQKEYHLYSPKETVERARSRVGENSYNLVTNNCEHFAIWCKTGISESHQVNKVLESLKGGIIPMVIGGI